MNSIFQLLELIAYAMAQFAVDSSYAETWGCRFWTIQFTMVGLCGSLITWTCIITNCLFSGMPRSHLVSQTNNSRKRNLFLQYNTIQSQFNANYSHTLMTTCICSYLDFQ